MARKILLADDSVTAQNMGRKILADAGYEVITVNNGSAALKKILELKPDLVILDVYMPGYSGLEVCQRLKESQDSARIPVLLTVGKLEPFKPEEAQRVRAEGFIVKPFEASELLSAMSRLEDKVVPRSEPSKPGRFARTLAAVEDASRDNRDESTGDNGWKSRIGFPRPKSGPEESVPEEAALYNSVNRDLRTVVETAIEKETQSPEPNKETQHPEPNVDLAALMPAGLPNGVTLEEVAAIATAAAQIQIAEAATRTDNDNDNNNNNNNNNDNDKNKDNGSGQRLAEARTSEPAIPLAPEHAPEPPAFLVSPASDLPDAASENSSFNPDLKAESKIESATPVVAETAANPSRSHQPAERSEEEQDIPMTMAAAAGSAVSGGPGQARWTAVAVALEGEESGISLDQEMQKAYAAFAASDTGPVAAPRVSAPAEPGSAPETVSSEPTDAASVIPVPAQPEPATAIAASAIPAAKVDHPAPQPLPQTEVALPEVEATSVNTPAATVPQAEPKADSEAVKTTAAAWASWRETHDTGDAKTSPVPEAKPSELEAPASGDVNSAALAAAAGAEHIAQEASAPPPENPSDVASIVDSVLADLRPRLMAEISRKMSEKK